MKSVHGDRRWAGIDVGGRRKGFHATVIAGGARSTLSLVAGPQRLLTPAAVLEWLARWSPRLVGVDAPRTLGDNPIRFEGERRLARELCHLRYTPTREALERQKQGHAPRYYEWIEHGLELYAALEAAGLEAIEAFPTASWTRWLGPRNGEPRAQWSTRALAMVCQRDIRLGGLPDRLDQDERDAVGAALTAYAYETGRCERYGDIVVPRAAAGTRPP